MVFYQPLCVLDLFSYLQGLLSRKAQSFWLKDLLTSSENTDLKEPEMSHLEIVISPCHISHSELLTSKSEVEQLTRLGFWGGETCKKVATVTDLYFESGNLHDLTETVSQLLPITFGD